MLTKATDVKLACLGMLNTWYSRLGLTEQKELCITKEFLERLEEIQAMNRVEACWALIKIILLFFCCNNFKSIQISTILIKAIN